MTTSTKPSETFIVLIPGFPEDEKDTTCLPAQQLLIREINRLYPSLQITVLAFQYPFHNKEYYWFGNRVISFDGRNKNGVSRLITWLKVFLKLRSLQKQKNVVGVFSCWCTECAFVGKYFTETNHLPHYIWICGQDARTNNKLVKLIRPNANSLIAISDFLVREFFKNHKIKPAHTIPIGIDPSLFTNKKNVARDICCLGVGSLIPLKQYEIFIDIVEQLKQQYPDINTMICGEGPEFEKLKGLIHTKNLQKNILLAGKKSHDEVLQLMCRSKILLHPSSYEGFGAVCIEALYAGAHVVSFCNPLDRAVEHWHIVEDNAFMLLKTREILEDPETDFSPVLVSDMEASAASIMKLFDYPAALR